MNLDNSAQSVEYVALVDQPAIEVEWMAFNKQFKFNEDKDRRLLMGPLMVADMPIYRRDEKGEYYVVFDKDTIYQIVQKFFRNGYQSNFNLMHDPNQRTQGVYVIESFIVDKSRGVSAPETFKNLYAYAPSAVSALLAAVATKVSVYVLLRFYFSVFGVGAVFGALPMADLLLVLAVAAMFVASAAAIWQDNLKHMLAYSSLGQIGYITFGIGLATPTGLTAGIVHLFNHGITKGALFMLAGCVAMRLGSVRFDRMAGIGKTMPWTCAGIVDGGLSLIGVPATAGFVSKWYLVLAAIEATGWWIAVLPVASSLLAVASSGMFPAA